MKQHPVGGFVTTTVDPPDDVMVVPAGLFGDDFAADRTNALLSLPLVARHWPISEYVLDFPVASKLEVGFPHRVVGIGILSDLDVALDRHFHCLD